MFWQLKTVCWIGWPHGRGQGVEKSCAYINRQHNFNCHCRATLCRVASIQPKFCKMHPEPAPVICPCQICGGLIEFDANSLSQGEPQKCECPHCKMETILFNPPPPTPESALHKIKTESSPQEKLANARIVSVVFRIIMVVCLILWFSRFPNGYFGGTPFYLSIAATIAAMFAHAKYKKLKNKPKPPVIPLPESVCSNCGTLLFKTDLRIGVCRNCKTNSIIPLATPRGQELYATYHGKLSARERVEKNDEAAIRLLHILEPHMASGGLATELEKLASLVHTGAITREEWQRAKAMYLGHPKDVQESTLSRIQQLHQLCRTGALSESEFNSVKWDILAKGMTKGFN